MEATGGQLNILTTAVVKYFTKNQLEQHVLAYLERRLETITIQDNLTDIVFALLDWSNRNGELLKLLNGLKEKNSNPLFAEPVDSILTAMQGSNKVGGLINPVDNCLIGGQIFIKRAELCQGINHFIQPGPFPKRISTITGADAVGKSYSWVLINHAARSAFNADSIKVDLLDRNSVGDWTPEEITRSLARQMELDESTIPDLGRGEEIAAGHGAATGASRRAIYLTDWLVGKLGSNEKRWWITIDGLEVPGVSNSVIDFVERIAEAIADQRITNVWLFLVGFNRTFKSKVHRTNFAVAYQPLNEHDVRTHAKALVRQYCVGDPSELDELAAQVAADALAGVDGLADRDNMEQMTIQFEASAERILTAQLA